MDVLLPSPPPYTPIDPHPRLPARNASPARPADSDTSPQYVPSQDPPFISGAPYFTMRSPTIPRPRRLIPIEVVVLSNACSYESSFPPQLHKENRDIDGEDWQAFMRHLLPDRAFTTRRSDEKRGLQSIESEVRGSRSANASPTPSRRLENARLLRKRSGVDLKSPPTPSSPTPSALLPRTQHLGRVVKEWNTGFFLPRGISIILLTSPPATALSSTLEKTASQLGQALFAAVKEQDIPTASLLLSHGADPSHRHNYGDPPIVLAVKRNNPQLLHLLLERGADTEGHACGAGTALYTVVKEVKVDMLQMLLLYGASIDNATPQGGEPALYRAVSKNQNEIVKILLAQPDLDLEKKPPGGCTPVYKAVKDGNAALVRLLLQRGAEAESHESGGPNAVYRAVKRGDLELTELLLEYGADVNYRASGGHTALYEAVKAEDKAMIKLLLDNGADVNKCGYGEKSPVTLASKMGKTELVEMGQ